MHELLTPREMAVADSLAIESGTTGFTLMEAAGRAVADTCCRMAAYTDHILVLAGPGNNGGDGFVAALVLKQRGFRVTALLLGDPARLKGDAALAHGVATKGGVSVLQVPEIGVQGAKMHLDSCGLVVDALFGAGLDRPLDGDAASLVEAVNAAGRRIIAVDLPSGISGATGQVMGTAVHASRTVTFFRRKPGHLLMPGRAACGFVEVADIGIPERVLDRIAPRLWVNTPMRWRASWQPPHLYGHKYDRGHAVIVSGPATATGAARLAAGAALRAGAGLVTVATPPSAAIVHAAHLTAVMIRSCADTAELAALLGDRRFNAVAIGPGSGVDEGTREKVAACLDGERSVVLDADALTVFADDPADLFNHTRGEPARAVLTPHEGEFSRIFPDLGRDAVPSKVERARAAAERSGAVVVLKGADSVVAHPDGRAVINDNASPWLATAGSGDVLTGIVTGLLAQGLPAFEAAAMAVWMHGAAGEIAGPGLTSEDLAPALKAVVARLAAEGEEDGR